MIKAPRLAYFISPHGFGHAARACSVISALRELMDDIEIDLFTTVPQWFFEESLEGPFHYHSVQTDIGLIQKNSIQEDLPKTFQALHQFYPLDSNLLSDLSRQLRERHCDVILCDIAPLGIAVGKAAGIPSVLIENFTWDWIYEGYESCRQEFSPFIKILRQLVEKADYRIQVEPVCKGERVDLVTAPVARKSRQSPQWMRNHLFENFEGKIITITMGGIQEEFGFLEQLGNFPDLRFLILGYGEAVERVGNQLRIPGNSPYYHPDLIQASDVVVGKIGYSTLAEIYHAQAVYGYISRPHFRESLPLSRFIEEQMHAVKIEESAFRQGLWLQQLDKLLEERPKKHQATENGADQIAQFLLRQFNSNFSKTCS